MTTEHPTHIPAQIETVCLALNDAFTAGAVMMRAKVARWHMEQGYGFADTAKKLEREGAHRDDIMRARWASASHHAHSTAILRSTLPMREDRA